MAVEDIFKSLATHMIQGIMTHEQMANYYDFLNLEGYKRCHEYHMFKEMCNFRKLNRYYINHYSKLIPEEQFENPQIIPENWYRHERIDVDGSTKSQGVKTALTKWVMWERETKTMYQQAYNDLLNMNEVASAMLIQEFISDVDCELKKAERYLINKENIGYNLGTMIAEQKTKHDKYKKKLDKMHICY